MYRILQLSLAWLLAGAVVAQHRVDPDGRPRLRDRLLKDEPSCEQLKMMWRFSKRQARAPEIMNEVSSYRDPLMYNEWPVYTAMPRVSPRFRYQYPLLGRETFGRVVTKAPPNVVRTPDYDEMFGMLNVPQTSGKILRYPGPSRPRPAYMVPPQRDRFDTLKKLVRQEHERELQRKVEAEQKLALKDLVASGRNSDDYPFNNYGENEPRGLQSLGSDISADEPGRHVNRKPQSGGRPVSQFSRYSDIMLPPARRSFPFDTPFDYLPYEY